MQIIIKVKPNQPKTEILEERDDFLKVALRAKPEKGEANRELIKFLEKEKGWSAEIISGKTSRKKLVKIYKKNSLRSLNSANFPVV